MADPKIFLVALSITPAPAITVDKEGNIEIGGVATIDPVTIGNAFKSYANALAGNQNKVRPWNPELTKK